MIPLYDENPSKTIPFVNILFILINVAVFIYQYFVFPKGAALFNYQLGCIPYEFSHFVDITPQSMIPVPFTIFTAMFMHGGWIHLLGNMLFLWIFGDNIEDKLGHIKYFGFYILCGISASLIHILTNFNSQIPSIGASGAIAGVMGAYILFFPGARIKTLMIWFVFVQIIRVPAFLILGYWILIQVLSGFAEFGARPGGGVAWFAHIGGFATGLLLTLKIKKQKRSRKR